MGRQDFLVLWPTLHTVYFAWVDYDLGDFYALVRILISFPVGHSSAAYISGSLLGPKLVARCRDIYATHHEHAAEALPHIGSLMIDAIGTAPEYHILVLILLRHVLYTAL